MGSNLGRDSCDVVWIDLRDEDDDEDLVHLVRGHVVEHGLQRRLQVALKRTKLVNV